ncbi:MAG: glycosyltransferase [Alphaproteobacteria bacterium]|nr:glycosyltransferase [Alphaproteobacteria bacterium]
MTTVFETWLSDRFPAAAQPAGQARIEEWRYAGAPAPLAWRSLAHLARSGGMLDLAIDTLERGLTEAPTDDGLLSDRACLATLVGDDDTARGLTARIAPGSPFRISPLLTAFEAGTHDDITELVTALGGRPQWDESHDRLVKACRQAGRAVEGAGFVAQWMGRHGIAPMALVRAGEALLEAGQPEASLRMLQPIWQANEDSLAAMIGPCRPPATPPDAIEARIERGLATPPKPPFALPGAETTPDSARVLFVGAATNGGREVFPNDLAAHLAATADLAGGRLDLWLDDAAGKPLEVRAPDSAIAQRLAALAEHIERTRPDIVLLDCSWSPTGRGLSRDMVAGWKARFGFRLVCMFRDALKAAQSLMEYWAEISEGVLVFDPHSPSLPAMGGKGVAIPVPALHPPFAPGTNDNGLLFVGGLAQPHRVMLLAALANRPLGLTLLIGAERKQRTASPADYAAELAKAGMVLNLAAHDQAERLVTGRVWESIACGALLLEQDGSGTEAFFTPWHHYLPWSHAGDIEGMCRVLERRPDLQDAIASRALAFARAHYGPDKVWRAVLAAGRERSPPNRNQS